MGKDLRGKELGSGLSQEPNGKYMARYTSHTPEGPKRMKKRFDTLQEARQWLGDSLYLDEHNDVLKGKDLLVSAWYNYWIEDKARKKRPNTVRYYQEMYELHIDKYIGNMLITDVKALHVQDILNRMGDAGYANGTIDGVRTTLSNMFRLAVDNDLLIKNPVNRSVDSKVGKVTSPKKSLRLNEQKVFLEYAEKNSYNNQYRLAIQTGLRTAELTGLKWSDIDMEKRVLHVQRTLSFRPKAKIWRYGPVKTPSSDRYIPLTNEAYNILLNEKEKQNKIRKIQPEWDGLVFLCRKGTPIKNNTYDTALYKICEKANIKHFSMHVLRHTFATRCAEAGVPPKTLKALMGHAKIAITMDYYVDDTMEERFKGIQLAEKTLIVS